MPAIRHKTSWPSPVMKVIFEDCCRSPRIGGDARADTSSWGNSESESEVSGSSALVSPVQSRRRPAHGLPRQHPHSRVRKVSAPPELQPHLGGTQPQHSNAHAHTTPGHGGTNPDHADRSSSSEFILSLPSQTQLSRGFYSSSDSGVPSEYSSCGGHVAEVNRHAPQTSFSPTASVNDLANQHQTHETQDVSFYQSDSDSESLDDVHSPQGHRTSGVVGEMNNQTLNHNHMEPSPLVLPVGSPPPLNRIPTEPIMNTPPSHPVGGHHNQARRHSMVVQLNLQGAATPLTGFTQAPNTTRSVSMVSLTGNPVVSTSMYPNLHNDTQSIYSDVGYSPPGAYHGIQHMDSQASLTGGPHKVESQQALVNPHPEAGCGGMPEAHHGAPQPVEDEEKKSWFIHTLSENLSIIYAVFLVTLGIVIYLADTFNNHDSAMAEAFNVFLIVVQLLWLFYVHVDVRRYVSHISRALEEAKTKQVNKDEQVQLEPTGDGQYQLRINVPEAPRTIPQYYGFTSGRHGGSLYLKIGATVFCLGYLIHTGLNLGQKILYLTEDNEDFENCTCTTDVVMYVLQPVYAFYQLFFIFKYSNLIINRRKVFARFGIMHCIASSLCFWVFTIMQETLQAIFMKSKDKGYNYSGTTDAYTKYSVFSDLDGDDSNENEVDHPVSYAAKKTSAASSWSINYGCENDTHLSSMINATTPYLYPFSIEFNILMVGLWILLWENIGRFERHTHIPSVEVTYEEDNSKSLSSNLIIYVDCHASNRGLFAGLLMTVATVISIILFFIFSASETTRALGATVNGASEVILLSCMLVAGFFAYNSIRLLDMIKHGISAVDDILLFVCLPCIFFYAFFTMVPSITDGNYLSVCVSILQVSQVILQTALMNDGLRRCSNSQALQHKKPGREVITYLVVANVAMWLLQTFEIKSSEGNSVFYDFYGKELWTLLSHLTLPLALFYRFHSSVCLADMWKAAYEPEESH
ncbi:proton channel OtopLc-like isoform X2 [Portunus trituberculatus]|uniref:proton channel OtopLc-like isoform X2 n=1 Tax=Portunus trituberculatus TaxID=210409 RepID=UPI001E1CE0E0|nr:proton channel OtopLc-like isoform X2 [Portunus trituberculatus]